MGGVPSTTTTLGGVPSTTTAKKGTSSGAPPPVVPEWVLHDVQPEPEDRAVACVRAIRRGYPAWALPRRHQVATADVIAAAVAKREREKWPRIPTMWRRPEEECDSIYFSFSDNAESGEECDGAEPTRSSEELGGDTSLQCEKAELTRSSEELGDTSLQLAPATLNVMCDQKGILEDEQKRGGAVGLGGEASGATDMGLGGAASGAIDVAYFGGEDVADFGGADSSSDIIWLGGWMPEQESSDISRLGGWMPRQEVCDQPPHVNGSARTNVAAADLSTTAGTVQISPESVQISPERKSSDVEKPDTARVLSAWRKSAGIEKSGSLEVSAPDVTIAMAAAARLTVRHRKMSHPDVRRLRAEIDNDTIGGIAVSTAALLEPCAARVGDKLAPREIRSQAATPDAPNPVTADADDGFAVRTGAAAPSYAPPPTRDRVAQKRVGFSDVWESEEGDDEDARPPPPWDGGAEEGGHANAAVPAQMAPGHCGSNGATEQQAQPTPLIQKEQQAHLAPLAQLVRRAQPASHARLEVGGAKFAQQDGGAKLAQLVAEEAGQDFFRPQGG